MRFIALYFFLRLCPYLVQQLLLTLALSFCPMVINTIKHMQWSLNTGNTACTLLMLLFVLTDYDVTQHQGATCKISLLTVRLTLLY